MLLGKAIEMGKWSEIKLFSSSNFKLKLKLIVAVSDFLPVRHNCPWFNQSQGELYFPCLRRLGVR